MALVDLSNICLWLASTLTKCMLLSCTSEGELSVGGEARRDGVKDVCPVQPIVAPFHLIMSLGVVQLVN